MGDERPYLGIMERLADESYRDVVEARLALLGAMLEAEANDPEVSA